MLPVLSMCSQCAQWVFGPLSPVILFCTHRESPSITLWDIQTGGLVHTFTLTMEATDTAISLNGRYLACGLSDGTVNTWEVANRTGGPAFESGSLIACLCWLAPEEQLMVVNGASLHIRDIASGSVLICSFEMQGPVRGAAYSQKLDRLAIVTSSGAESSITIINPQVHAPPASHRHHRCASSASRRPQTPTPPDSHRFHQRLSLGTRAQIPTGHIVNTLRAQATCDSNMPSD